MNAVRVPLIRRAARALEPRGVDQTGSLAGLSIVDIGCGGGILSEALARLGARVTGVDAAPENVVAAEHHRRLDPRLGEHLSYVNTTAEQLVEAGHRFDIVVASEVLEHVSDVPAFLTAASSLMKPEGALVITTLNRSLSAFALAIVGAEYVTRLVPTGTHEWAKFVRPSEIRDVLASKGAMVTEMTGLQYNPLLGRWGFCDSLAVNYGVIARRRPTAVSPVSG